MHFSSLSLSLSLSHKPTAGPRAGQTTLFGLAGPEAGSERVHRVLLSRPCLFGAYIPMHICTVYICTVGGPFCRCICWVTYSNRIFNNAALPVEMRWLVPCD